jgi:NitT/TauT family transport system substrate-binding protein
MKRFCAAASIALFAIAYSTFTAAAEPASTKNIAIRVGNAPLAPLWGYPVINQAKLWKPYLPNADVQGFESMTGMALVNNLLAGKLDIAYFADMPAIVIASKANIFPTKLVALDTADEGGASVIYVGKNSPIKSVKELHGRAVSVPFGGYTHRFAEVVEAAEGIKFKFVGQSPEVGLTALQAGKVEAYIPWPPYGSLSVDKGFARKLVDGTVYRFSSIRGIVVSRQFAEQHPDVLAGWLRAQLDAQRIMRERPAYAAKLIAEEWKAFAVPVAIIQEGFSYQKFPEEISPQWRKVLIDGAEFLRSHKFIEASIDFDSFIDDSYLKKASAMPSQLDIAKIPMK